MPDTITCPECGWENIDDGRLRWTHGRCLVCDTQLPDWEP